MRYAVLADIHANLPALDAVIADALQHHVGHFVCLGDIVGYGPQPVEAVDRVFALTPSICLGNHDAAACDLLNPSLFNTFARETAERAHLALSEDVRAKLCDLPYILEGDGFACAHSGFVSPERFYYLEDKKDAMLSLEAQRDVPLLFVGHTHAPCLFAYDLKGRIRKLPPADFSLNPQWRYVVNPGAVGFPRGNDLGATYVIYDSITRRIVFRHVPYDLAAYRLAIVRNGYNLLNYWFLSPSARRLRTEQAFLQPPASPAEGLVTACGKRGFRLRPHPKLPKAFLVLVAIFILFIVMAATMLLWMRPVFLPTIQEQQKPTNFLPALPEWLLSTETQAVQQRVTDQTLTFTSDTRVTTAMISPLITVPKAQALQLSFEVMAQSKENLKYSAQVVFVRADGEERKDQAHRYTRARAQSYKVRIPADAVSLRVELTFDFFGDLTFSNPTLQRK
ncbi:MAG: metallophosphoesterase family protein [Kiritimatiellia bacterium]